MPVTKYVARWLARAEEDLEVAEMLIKEQRAANVICFHSQQAAEKYLKGFLVHRKARVRKIHALDALLEECETHEPAFHDLRDDAVYLNQFYSEARYPADTPDFTMKDAKKSYETARRMEKFVMVKF